MTPASRKEPRPRARAGPWAAAVIALAVPAAALAAPWEDAPAGASYVGEAACLECHEDRAMSGFHTGSGVERSCEACHGPGSVHVESGVAADILGPSTEDPVRARNACLSCHASGMHAFEASMHGAGEVSCSDCHSVHGEARTALLTVEGPELCLSCHQDVRAALSMPSHHPVREGGVGCTDCHDPHQDLEAALDGGRTNDLCFRCHSAMEGPFIFEHSPVIEDCGICHVPHGAVANNLLRQNEPFLCLQCHQAHFHATIPGIDAEFTSLDGYGGMSTHDASKRGFLTKCTQCHSEVHGSDLPSQSVSGQGRALTR